MSAKLLIDGKWVELDADYALRFNKQQPTLYYKGRRVVKEWTLSLSIYSPADPQGGNANTTEH